MKFFIQFTLCITIGALLCTKPVALIMRDRDSGQIIETFVTPTLSEYVGPKREMCGNLTNLEAVAMRANDHFCKPLTPDQINWYSGKMVLVRDVFEKNPGRCPPELQLRNAALAGVKTMVSVVNRVQAGKAIVYKATGYSSNEGSVPFITAGIALTNAVSFDYKAGNLTTNHVFDVTCDPSPYAVSVYVVGPILLTLLGLFAWSIAYNAFKALLHFKRSKKSQVSQTAILTVLFLMNFIDGFVLILGITGFTTHSPILGDEVASYVPKAMFQMILMSMNLLAVLWTGIFWSLLQRQMKSMTSRKNAGSPNIFIHAPIRSFLAVLFTIPFDVVTMYLRVVYDNRFDAAYAPLITMVSLGCGIYFYKNVASFFRTTGFSSKTSIAPSERTRKSSMNPSRRGSTSKSVPPFMVKLARALKRFSVFLFFQVTVVMLVIGLRLSKSPVGQNAGAVFSIGTFGMSYYMVSGLAPSSKSGKGNSSMGSGTSTVGASKFQSSHVN